MALTWNVLGHKKQIDFLSRAIETNKIAHAYAFCGPDGVGKRLVAANLARILLCDNKNACDKCIQCKSFSSNLHPDFIQISSSETIKIEQIRQLVYSLSLKPYQAGYKVAVIDRAEDMTVEAANALLKSMEEPRAYTILILITANPYRLLPTITSRAQKINFGLVPESEYSALLPENLTLKQKEAIENFATGRPGVAVKIANEPESLEKLLDLDKQYQYFLKGNLPDKLKIVSELTELETTDIKDAMQFWLTGLEKKLISTGDSATAKKIESVAVARNLLEANVNAKLLLTQLMLD